MTTAADRLKQLSGLAGVSAATMLLAIGTGYTASEILTSESPLSTGTAAEHLLSDRGGVPAESEYSMRWAPPVEHGVSLFASATTTEREVTIARCKIVITAHGNSLESSSHKATARRTVDSHRISRLDEDLLWL